MARKTKRTRKFPWGWVTQASRDLGVTQGHLNHVLSGNRESASLTARWEAWLAQKKASLSK